MSTESLEAQAVGGAEAVGVRLADARRQRGWTVEQAAASMKVPAHVVESLEKGMWQRLGAPVFVRGQLRSYARLLGLDEIALVEQAPVEQWVPVEIVSHVRSHPLRRWTGGLLRRGLMLVLAVLLLVGVGMLLRQQFAGDVPVASLDEFPVADAMDAQEAQVGTSSPVVPDEPATDAAPSLVAATDPAGSALAVAAPQVDGMSGAAGQVVVPDQPARPAPAAAGGQLELDFAGQSWIEIHGRDGRVIERAMVGAGQSRRYPSHEVGRVLLGNSADITARLNGAPLDLSGLRRSNVARFTVSSDGSALPVSN